MHSSCNSYRDRLVYFVRMFVVFEGIDGSGKTTVSNQVARKLREAGLSVEHLREGGQFSSAVTQALREFGRDARNLALTPQAELFLYVTRDVQLLDEMIRPALGRADVVIADRYLYSAEVLARFGRGLPETLVRPVLDAAAGGLAPDLVVLVDVDPHLARARRQAAKIQVPDRRPPSRKGQAGVGMQHRFRAGYQQLAASDPGRWAVVDNEGDLEATIERVFTLIKDAVAGVSPALARFRQHAPAPPAAPSLSTPDQALEVFLRWIDVRAAREPHVAAYFLGGLWGRGIDDRRRTLAERAPETILAGLSALDDAVSWELREALGSRFPGRVARTLTGLGHRHPRARRLRAQLVGMAPADVVASLEGIGDEEAWGLRDRIYSTAPDIVVGSTATLSDGRAWATRQRWLAERGGTAALAEYETARVACKSITGLDDDAAWELRKEARAAAPVAALASLLLVTGERSWKWRQRFIDRAPKTVFATLRGSDDARAWELRDRLCVTCKEAIDSLSELDSPKAWALRERCADVWPSTVVKSLGPLASTPRGQALVERQLGRHADNISLLKHAAAIAVGANVASDVVD
jgi:dTMP kinase